MKIHSPVLTELEKATQVGLQNGGDAVLERSNELAPKDTEATIKSGRVDIDDLTVQVSYPGLVARLQHENLDYQHDDGGPKYLERASVEVDITEHVAAEIRRRFGG